MAALTLIIAAVAVVSFALWKCIINLRKNKVPKGLKPLPGPKGYPIIGSVPDVPEKNSFVHFGEWSKKYGPIYQCNLAGTNHVWISTDQIARDLLSKKGNIYSDRPHIPALINDNRTSNQYLPLMSKNAGWTRQRKFANHIMRETEKASFYHYPELESVRLLQELMDNVPYNTALESFISRTTCRLAWGHPEASDELKQRARELLIGVSPTGALGNKIAALMSLPDWMVPAKAWERRRLLTERQWFKTMEDQVKSDTSGKEAKPSWMKTGLDTFAKWGFVYDMEASYCVGMHGIAGALTVAAPMQAMCLALCYYPQYQDMLHEELDRVCGDRMPRAEDRPNLPVLRAFIRETLRWRPPVPTGIPHEVTQDDEYNGYHIPKGSVMHPLEWAIARDPELFPDPEEFNPLRWLKPEYPTYQEPLTQYPTIINSTQFGYGRRTCQGQGVADEDMLVGLGSLAWLFKIGKEDAVRPNVQAPTSTEKQGLYSNENATISNEELNAGMPYTDDEKAPLYPGAFPPVDPLEAREQEEKANSKKSAPLDPTLDFSTLLIAKPLPFKFDLTVRNPDRARLVVDKFSELKEQGEFPAAKSYWKEGEYLGWGKV